MDYEKICNEAITLIKEVGIYVHEFSSTTKNIMVKGKNDFVTEIDKSSEQKLVNGLLDILPEAGFIAEENTSNKRGETFNWIIDPIDGTTNFIHGLFPHAISVALMENEEIVIGIVYEIGLSECFYSWKGGKTYCNNEVISVSSSHEISNSLIATGFPYYDYSRINQFQDTLEYFMRNSHGIRRLGSAATDLAYIAAGRFDAFYEYCLKPWDVAAGSFLVTQAGGKVSDFKGGNNYLFGQEIIASNNAVFNEFSNIISSKMNL